MNAESLPILFRSLELSAFAREAESALARAETENWGYRRLLQHLAEAEVQDRRARKIERLLKYGPHARPTLLQLSDSKQKYFTRSDNSGKHCRAALR
jgi:DNA replication protein DnaC